MTNQRTQGKGTRAASPPDDETADPLDGTGRAATCSLSVGQLDAMERLLGTIAAQGDLLATVHAADLAPGTLPAIGQAIQEQARAIRDILDEAEAQRPGRAGSRRGEVEELRAGYAAGLLRLVASPPPRPAATSSDVVPAS